MVDQKMCSVVYYSHLQFDQCRCFTIVYENAIHENRALLDLPLVEVVNNICV